MQLKNDTNGKMTLSKAFSLSRFRKEEAGSMVIFTLFVLTLMLIVGGMAVDFMRFEARRAMMQGALDNAVLAAADLDQSLDPKSVVTDYLSKSQVGNCLSADPVVVPNNEYRRVEAKCNMVLDTFFLRLIGMDEMDAKAASTAIEGVGNIEVSLVLDISGSMNDPIISGQSTLRITKMREAATAFVDELLKPEFADRVSISLIPYSENVNIGPALFGTLNTTGYGNNTDTLHNYSHCIIFPDAAYASNVWDNSLTYRQMAHFQLNTVKNSSNTVYLPDITRPICPSNSYEQIIPISQNKTALNAAIAQLQPRAGTSIFIGLKWAMNLLDPSFNSNIASLGTSIIDPAFNTRPLPYSSTTSSNDTVKYIVLMTDGENWNSTWPKTYLYNDENAVAHWASMNFPYFYNERVGGSTHMAEGELLDYDVYNNAIGNTHMAAVCDAAKAQGIIIFGIAMGSTPGGKVEMSKCASSSGHYFETSGAELVAIFKAIAKQITDLRLTQ